MSTEDGRVIFYSTSIEDNPTSDDEEPTNSIPDCEVIAQLGGAGMGMSTRIKDFEILRRPGSEGESEESNDIVVVTGSSDGAIRVWAVTAGELSVGRQLTAGKVSDPEKGTATAIKQIGRLQGTYETRNRITCLKAFVMSNEEDDSLDGPGGDTDAPESDSEADSDE